MKNLNTEFSAHLASGTTTLAWCWRVIRVDGVVFGFTDHDAGLSFDGTAFEPQAGMIPSEIRSSSDLAVDAQDAEGVLSSDLITETDIMDGLWDGAAVEVWRVNWQDPEQRVLLRKGTTGQIRRGKVSFVAEVRSMSHALDQSVGRTYQYTCDRALGDSKCKINLDDPAYFGEGTVGTKLRGRAFTSTEIGGFASDWFGFGKLVWVTGSNAGRRVEVSRHEVSSGVALLTLLEEPVLAIAEGDQFTIYAGCDKRWETCRSKFGNGDNFRGFPDIPGTDTVVRYATKSRDNTGAAL